MFGNIPRQQSVTEKPMGWEKFDESFLNFCLSGDAGERNPRNMAPHFLSCASSIDYSTAVRADIGKQNHSTFPRYWYVDVLVECDSCEEKFIWSAAEQRAWFEEYRFYVDSFPKQCATCRKQSRNLKALRKEYDGRIDRTVSGTDLLEKQAVVTIIDGIMSAGETVPERMKTARETLLKQIGRAEQSSDSTQ